MGIPTREARLAHLSVPPRGIHGMHLLKRWCTSQHRLQSRRTPDRTTSVPPMNSDITTTSST